LPKTPHASCPLDFTSFTARPTYILNSGHKFYPKGRRSALATNNNNNKKIKIQPYTHDRDGMKLQGFVNVNEKLNKNEDIFIYIQLTLVEIIMISPASH
jgi:hypothetical protein